MFRRTTRDQNNPNIKRTAGMQERHWQRHGSVGCDPPVSESEQERFRHKLSGVAAEGCLERFLSHFKKTRRRRPTIVFSFFLQIDIIRSAFVQPICSSVVPVPCISLTEHGCDQFARARWLVLLREWKGVNSCRFQVVANIQDSVEHLLRLYEGRHF